MKWKRKLTIAGVLALSAGLLTGIFAPVYVSFRQARLDHALIAAIKREDAKQTISLLNQGANPNAIDSSGEHLTLHRILVDLWDRLRNGPPKPVGFRPTALTLSYSRSLWYNGPGRPVKEEVWAAMLRHGANPLTKDEVGSTLLSYAASDNHVPTVRLLMALHVDPNVGDGYGSPPLMYADYECARLLLDHGADPNRRSFGGDTPLIVSAVNYFSAGNLLLDRGADINAQNVQGRTPLMQVFIFHKYDFTGARILLDRGARVTIRDKSGKTALDYARKRKVKGLIARMEAIARQEKTLRPAARK